jgi:Pectate lyase superfamily protein
MNQHTQKNTTRTGLMATGLVLLSAISAVAQPTSALWTNFKDNASPRLVNWGDAGYLQSNSAIPNRAVTHNVTSYGAVANDGKDDTVAVQKAIDAAENAGGGVVFFPSGQFDFQKVNNNVHALNINKPNVVLRGNGSGTGGTLLKQWTRKPTGAGLEIWNLIDIRGSVAADGGVKLAVNATKHSRQVKLINNSQKIKAGDVLRLELISSILSNGARDPRINLKFAAPASTANGVVESRFEGFNGYTVHSVTVQAKSVAADGVTINLWQPLPSTFEVGDNARVRKFTAPIYFCGVEKLKILGGFDNTTYAHHRNWESDYGWNGIGITSAIHCFVRDVALEKMTEDVLLHEATNCTIDNIRTLTAGHVGISMVWSYYNLCTNYQMLAHRSHGISMANQSAVNVWTGINNKSGTFGEIDFHGSGRSHSNLVENSTNMRVSSSGDVKNLLHAGQFNTFWNIETGPPVVADDFFSQGVYNYSNNGAFPIEKQHQHFPKSIVVGIGRKGAKVKIGNNVNNRDDAWLYVDCTGGNYLPQSLYKAQHDLNK